MSTINIGFLSFKLNPREGIPPMRFRALHAEAVVQGAAFSLLDWADFDEAADRIKVWSWGVDGWESEQRPLPDLVIISGVPFMEQQFRLREWIHKARLYIQDAGFVKSRLKSMLTNTDYDKYLIPDEEIPAAGSSDVITEFLTKHGSSVIKRSNSSRGKGLHFVLKDMSGWRMSDNLSCVFTLKGIVDEILRRIKGRLAYREFVIQKYIRSVAPDCRAADIRVHVQRNAEQTLGVTRAYVRLAEVGSLKTNISCGGYQGPLMGFLGHRTHRSALDIQTEMYSAAVEIAELQSALAPRPLSELGIDFLLDEEDRIWLVETNALPQSSLHEHQRAINTIGYALSLLADKPAR